nr:hypothetical protein [Pedobacter panaciterrae]
MEKENKSKQPFNLKEKLGTEIASLLFENKIIYATEIFEADYRAKYVVFKDVVFEGPLVFTDTNLFRGIRFENAVFKSTVCFDNVRTGENQEHTKLNYGNVAFINCDFQQIISFGGTSTFLENSLSFFSCRFEFGLILEEISIGHELQIVQCNINNVFIITNLTVKQGLILDSNRLEAHSSITDIQSTNIEFNGLNIFSKRLQMSNLMLAGRIVFNGGTFKQEVTFKLNNAASLELQDSNFEKAFYVHFFEGDKDTVSSIKNFTIKTSKFGNGLIVSGTAHPNKKRPKIDHISLEFSPLLTGNVNFNDFHVNKLELTGYNTSAKLALKNIAVNQMRIVGLINEGGLILSNIQPLNLRTSEEIRVGLNSIFYVDDSNFGKAQLFNIDFHSFAEIRIHNVILTEISTSLVKWFSKKQLENGQIKPLIAEIKQGKKDGAPRRRIKLLGLLNSKREICRQLKYAAQKQGDLPLSHEFQRMEMEYYQLVTRYQKPKQWSEYLIMWSSASNNFGQSWLRALYGLIFFSLLSYIPIGFLTSDKLNYHKIARTWNDLRINLRVITYDNFKSWFILLNPTHRITELADDISKYSSWLYFWDILSRIIVAYFIFQMVSAFRKFSK